MLKLSGIDTKHFLQVIPQGPRQLLKLEVAAFPLKRFKKMVIGPMNQFFQKRYSKDLIKNEGYFQHCILSSS